MAKLSPETQNIIGAFITAVLIPEFVAWLRRRREAQLPPPTEEELVERLHAAVGRHLVPGEAFLAEKGIVLPESE